MAARGQDNFGRYDRNWLWMVSLLPGENVHVMEIARGRWTEKCGCTLSCQTLPDAPRQFSSILAEWKSWCLPSQHCWSFSQNNIVKKQCIIALFQLVSRVSVMTRHMRQAHDTMKITLLINGFYGNCEERSPFMGVITPERCGGPVSRCMGMRHKRGACHQHCLSSGHSD